MESTIKTPQWLDTDQYPFKSRFLPLKNGTMHYLDEGVGDVILFIHGTPTWSFLYREFIKHFSKDYRCIAIDHLGFGLSDKPSAFDGTPESHSRNLIEFIERLSLRNITLVVHDFGGPIGLAAANCTPEKFDRIVLFNTWLWETKSDPSVQKINKIVNSWIGKVLYKNFNFSPKVLFKQGFYNKQILRSEIHAHYLHPFSKKNDRMSLLKLAKSLLGSSAWYERQSKKITSLKGKPWLILWGTKDTFLTLQSLSKWNRLIPDAHVRLIPSGHFVQEESPKLSIYELENFLNIEVSKKQLRA